MKVGTTVHYAETRRGPCKAAMVVRKDTENDEFEKVDLIMFDVDGSYNVSDVDRSEERHYGGTYHDMTTCDG